VNYPGRILFGGVLQIKTNQRVKKEGTSAKSEMSLRETSFCYSTVLGLVEGKRINGKGEPGLQKLERTKTLVVRERRTGREGGKFPAKKGGVGKRLLGTLQKPFISKPWRKVEKELKRGR